MSLELVHYCSTTYVFYENIKFVQRKCYKNGNCFVCSLHGCNAKIKIFDLDLNTNDNDTDHNNNDNDNNCYTNFKFFGNHSNQKHEIFDTLYINKLKFKNKVYSKCSESKSIYHNSKPREIYNNIALQNENISCHVPYHDVKQRCYSLKNINKIPSPKYEYQIKNWIISNNLDNNSYLGDLKNGKIQIFCPEWGAICLRDCKLLFVDVSFKYTPLLCNKNLPYKGALHLVCGYNVHNDYIPPCFHCCTILMKKAKPSESDYNEAFDELQSQCIKKYNIDIFQTNNNNNNSNDIKTILSMMDMEEPLRSSIESHYHQCILKICLFHYSKAIVTNIKDKGLGSNYITNGKNFDINIYYFLRDYISLSLMKPKYITRTWNLLFKKSFKLNINKTDHNKIVELVLYHKKYYMKSSSYIMQWNHFNANIRTNNHLETLNYSVLLFYGTHKDFSEFMLKNNQYFKLEYIKLNQYKNGKIYKRKKDVIIKNQCLIKLMYWLNTIDNPTDNDLLCYLKYVSIALKGNIQSCQKILNKF